MCKKSPKLRLLDVLEIAKVTAMETKIESGFGTWTIKQSSCYNHMFFKISLLSSTRNLLTLHEAIRNKFIRHINVPDQSLVERRPFFESVRL